MTAATPAGGSSWTSRLPPRRAALRVAACRLNQRAAAGRRPGAVVDDLVLAVSEAVTNVIRYGSCNLQPVKVAVGVQGGWIQATIRDQGRPPSRTAPLMSLRGRGLWLIGQLVDELRLAKARPGMLVPLRQCISLGDSAGSASCAMVG